MSEGAELKRRNPGPSWGYVFISFVNRYAPWWLMQRLLQVGSLVAYAFMSSQRRQSKRFLSDVYGRTAKWYESWKHFTAFSEFLVRRFEAASGRVVQFRSVGGAAERMNSLVEQNQQTLHGTFHYGNSDLMGFWMSRYDIDVSMIRYKVDNSRDVEWLESCFGENISFVWVNDPKELLFALKNSVQDGASIAMKCDRVEHSSKIETFEFLGRRRLFPFTIYHLSILFELPVMFTFGLPVGQMESEVYSSKIFTPDGANKKEKLELARSHFRDVLRLLEGLVKRDPYQWFNFVDALPDAE